MLLDSNVIIYASQPEHGQIRQFIGEHDIVVSAVSYVEVMGYHRLTEEMRCLRLATPTHSGEERRDRISLAPKLL